MTNPTTSRCLRCKWGTANPGDLICWTCAIGITRRACPHDGTPELLIYRFANGHQNPQVRCRACYKTMRTPRLRDINPDMVEGEVRDFRKLPNCARCGRDDAIEIHHWAPRQLFPDDADDWPTSPLCPDCHHRWHVTTGTATKFKPRTP